ncbi:MAG: lysylphosphatidylglycerol synthase domain-containing protein [Mycoplasma sp.]|nr:lysylphosphatidylglycerol synthase domain-containing protein [Mycoplasma sp.]
MINNNYSQWSNSKKLISDDYKNIKKYNNDKIDDLFNDSFSFSKNQVTSIVELGSGYFNKYTLTNMTMELLNKIPIDKEILITHDGSENAKHFSFLMQSIFSQNDRKIISFKHNEGITKGFAYYFSHKYEMKYAIYLNSNSKKLIIENVGTGVIDFNFDSNLKEDVEYSDNWKINNENLKVFSNDVIEDFSELVLSSIIDKNNLKDCSVLISSNSNYQTKLIEKIIGGSGIDYFISKRTTKNKIEKNKIYDKKILRRIFRETRAKKADVGIVQNFAGTKSSVIVKHKKRYAFLEDSEWVGIYLEYLSIKNITGYIILSTSSNRLLFDLAKKNNIKVVTYNSNEDIIPIIKKYGKKDFLFGFDEGDGFINNKTLNHDSIVDSLIISDMCNYFKSQSKSLYSMKKWAMNKSGSWKEKSFREKLNYEIINNLFKRINTKDELGGFKIVNKETISFGLNYKKIIIKFKDQKTLVLSQLNETLRQTYYFKDDENISNTIRDIKKVKDDIFEFTEDLDSKKITKKTVIKNLIYLAVLAGILVFVFEVVYYKTGIALIQDLWSSLKNSSHDGRVMWIILAFLAPFSTRLLEAFFTIRASKVLGSQVKLRHSYIASIISIVISNITPLSIGGSAGSYWYMRKKGYTRRDMAASYSLNVLFYQIKVGIMAIVFLPIGLNMFSSAFFADTPAAKSLLTLTIIGLSFDIFATVMIALLIFSKRIHYWIVVTTTTLLDWTFFIKDNDWNTAQYLNEMADIRYGINFIMTKKWLVLELAMYEFIPIFILGGYFSAKIIGIPNETSGSYWKFMVGTKLVQAANSLSPTPGAAGTTEWFTIKIFSVVFNENSAGKTQSLVDDFTAMYRLFDYMIPVIISTWVLLSIYGYERHNIKIKKINKNLELMKKKVINDKKFKMTFISINGGLLVSIMIVLGILLYT